MTITTIPPTLPPLATPQLEFTGYTPIERNDINYPPLNAMSFYTHPNDFYKTRLQIKGFIITLGYVEMNGQTVYVIQMGFENHPPSGQIVPMLPILVLNFQEDSNININDGIIRYNRRILINPRQ